MISRIQQPQATEQNLQKMCLICREDLSREDIKNEQITIILECIHIFHLHCATRWAQERAGNLCPACKFDSDELDSLCGRVHEIEELETSDEDEPYEEDDLLSDWFPSNEDFSQPLLRSSEVQIREIVMSIRSDLLSEERDRRNRRQFNQDSSLFDAEYQALARDFERHGLLH